MDKREGKKKEEAAFVEPPAEPFRDGINNFSDSTFLTRAKSPARLDQLQLNHSRTNVILLAGC